MTIREQIEAAKSAELITVQQLALLSQYDPQTIYRKAHKGEIPGMVRFGRGIRFVRIVALGFVRRSQEDRDLRPTF
jgi:predicted DNA-binding transcriptional regulator AlpA